MSFNADTLYHFLNIVLITLPWGWPFWAFVHIQSRFLTSKERKIFIFQLTLNGSHKSKHFQPVSDLILSYLNRRTYYYSSSLR